MAISPAQRAGRCVSEAGPPALGHLLEDPQVGLDHPAAEPRPRLMKRVVQRPVVASPAVAATRVPPAASSRNQPRLSRTPSPTRIIWKRRARPGLEALEPDVGHQQADSQPSRPGGSGRRPAGHGRSKPQLRERARPGRPGHGRSPRPARRAPGCRSGARARRVAAQASERASVTCSGRRSGADRMPDRLHLEEGNDPLRALGGAIVRPVERRVGDPARPASDPLDRFGRRRSRPRPAAPAATPQVSRASTSTCAAMHRHQLRLRPRSGC